MALKDNALLLSESARIDETRFAGVHSRGWPGLSVEVSGGRRTDESTSGPLFEAAFAQSLPIGKKLNLRGQLFDLESESWQTRRSVTEASITFDVVQYSFEYAIHRRLSNLVQKRQERFALIKSYLEGRVFASPQKKAERNIVQNRLKSLFVDAIRSESATRASFEKLRPYLSLEPGRYPDILVPWFSGTKHMDQNELIQKALASSPELHLKELSIKSAEIEKTLATRNRWPDPKVLGSYEEANASNREQNTRLGLGLDFPVWSRTRSGIKSAESKLKAEQALRDYEQWQIKIQLPRAVAEYEASRRIVQEYPQSLRDDLEAQLRETEQGFRRGQTDLLTFLELESSTAETYNRALQSQLDLLKTAIEIFRISGQRDIVGQLDSF
jgi:outer membrane protein TolC